MSGQQQLWFTNSFRQKDESAFEPPDGVWQIGPGPVIDTGIVDAGITSDTQGELVVAGRKASSQGILVTEFDGRLVESNNAGSSFGYVLYESPSSPYTYHTAKSGEVQITGSGIRMTKPGWYIATSVLEYATASETNYVKFWIYNQADPFESYITQTTSTSLSLPESEQGGSKYTTLTLLFRVSVANTFLQMFSRTGAVKGRFTIVCISPD